MRFRDQVDWLQLTEGDLDKSRIPKRVFVVARRAVPCYVERTSGREVRTAVGEKVLVDHTIIADPAPPWRAQDRLRYGGLELEIVDVDPDAAGRGRQSETVARTAARRS
jgi:hypothetical protein